MTLKHLSDTELVKIYQDTQNNNAFGELYNRYERKVFLSCVKILKNRENAYDLTQDIFLKIANKLLGLKETFAFKKWLFRIAYNDSITMLRNQKNILSTYGDEVNYIIDSKSEDELNHSKEQQIEKVAFLLKQVSEKDKTILTEKYLKGLTITELMEKYNLSESAVKMQLTRARDRVRNFSPNLMVA